MDLDDRHKKWVPNTMRMAQFLEVFIFLINSYFFMIAKYLLTPSSSSSSSAFWLKKHADTDSASTGITLSLLPRDDWKHSGFCYFDNVSSFLKSLFPPPIQWNNGATTPYCVKSLWIHEFFFFSTTKILKLKKRRKKYINRMKISPRKVFQVLVVGDCSVGKVGVR